MMNENVKLRPQQEMLYSLIEASDAKWFQDETETPSVIAHVVKVDLQQRTIILPKGEFNLDNFLHIVKDIYLRSL